LTACFGTSWALTAVQAEADRRSDLEMLKKLIAEKLGIDRKLPKG
jgi:hypothetical protein